MTAVSFDNLFIFEMANNHMGDVDHGIRIIEEFAAVRDKFDFPCAFKFQYRDIDTFIHPDYKDRFDFKYVKRFTETRFAEENFLILKKCMEDNGFISICTPFDEVSVDKVVKHGFQVIKIASCSFTDWPLLEKIALTDKPIIASTAGASLDDIDRVVSFFEHRQKQLAIMHCVGEYPTATEHLNVGQIEFFRKRYQNVTIGYSTHEEPDNCEAIKIAVAMGAKIFERHVGVPTDKYALNAYSSTPAQVEKWMAAATAALAICGDTANRREIFAKEADDLRGLRRGVFVKNTVAAGEKIGEDNLMYAIPCFDDQVLANDVSKYTQFIAKKGIEAGQPLYWQDVETSDLRSKILAIVKEVREMLIAAKLHLPNKLDFELSHHYGIDKFHECGATIINCINREYCKKLIILLPGQSHPSHYHKKKEETFQVLAGELFIDLGDGEKAYKPGDIVVVKREQSHSFRSDIGAIFEEVSTTHYKDDSFYAEADILQNKHRKTAMTFWSDWIKSEPV